MYWKLFFAQVFPFASWVKNAHFGEGFGVGFGLCASKLGASLRILARRWASRATGEVVS